MNMNNHNENLCKGLHLMYLGTLISLVSLLGGFVPMLSWVLSLVALGGAIVSCVGLVKIRSEHADYRNALILLAVSFLCNLIPGGNGGFGVAIKIVSSTAQLIEIYFVVRATNSLLREGGFTEQAARGDKAWKWQVGVVVASVVVLSIGVMGINVPPALLMVGLVGGSVLVAVSAYALILYLSYLNESSKVL